MNIAFILVLGFLAAVYGELEMCSGPEDCPDAGTTCDQVMGLCRCWTEHSALAADAWSCDDDATCARSFPGHVCRVSFDCRPTFFRMGYCTPIGARRTTAALAVKADVATTSGTVAPPTTTGVTIMSTAPATTSTGTSTGMTTTTATSTIVTTTTTAATTTATVTTTMTGSVSGGYNG